MDHSNSHSASYAAAGVDVTAGYEAVKRIKPMVESTYIPGVMGTLGGFGGMFMQAGDAVGSYVTEINSAMNLTVVLQMFGIAVLLTLFAGAASLLFIMRYEPLKILANRD